MKLFLSTNRVTVRSSGSCLWKFIPMLAIPPSAYPGIQSILTTLYIKHWWKSFCGSTEIKTEANKAGFWGQGRRREGERLTALTVRCVFLCQLTSGRRLFFKTVWYHVISDTHFTTVTEKINNTSNFVLILLNVLCRWNYFCVMSVCTHHLWYEQALVESLHTRWGRDRKLKILWGSRQLCFY